MRKKIVAFLALGLCLPAGFAEEKDRDGLQGTWAVVSAERNGEAAKDLDDHVLKFRGAGQGRHAWHARGRVGPPRGEVRVDPQARHRDGRGHHQDHRRGQQTNRSQRPVRCVLAPAQPAIGATREIIFDGS